MYLLSHSTKITIKKSVCQVAEMREQGYLKVLEKGSRESFLAKMRETSISEKAKDDSDELEHVRRNNGTSEPADGDRRLVGVSSL